MSKTVGEVSQTIKSRLDAAADDIDKSLQKIESEDIIPKKQYYIVDNRFWDKWLQKLFAQLISVKVWGLIILTVLIIMSAISGEQFIIGFTVILGTKGGKDIVMKWVESKRTNNISEDEIIDRV